jgi:hypothetical protein
LTPIDTANRPKLNEKETASLLLPAALPAMRTKKERRRTMDWDRRVSAEAKI